MRGKDIPLQTIYSTSGKKRKEPLYVLQPAEVIKAKQDKLGENAGWYYGTWCDKCCGVYPAFMSEQGFRDYGYYVCLVCGKESLHEPMPWQCRDDWNAGRYEWKPEKVGQLTIFDWLEGSD